MITIFEMRRFDRGSLFSCFIRNPTTEHSEYLRNPKTSATAFSSLEDIYRLLTEEEKREYEKDKLLKLIQSE